MFCNFLEVNRSSLSFWIDWARLLKQVHVGISVYWLTNTKVWFFLKRQYMYTAGNSDIKVVGFLNSVQSVSTCWHFIMRILMLLWVKKHELTLLNSTVEVSALVLQVWTITPLSMSLQLHLNMDNQVPEDRRRVIVSPRWLQLQTAR